MILRKLADVEKVDVGKKFGHPEGTMLIQWIISNEVGDERYRHRYALRKYTRQPQPNRKIEDVPFHSHKYVQSPHILTGRMLFENDRGDSVTLGPGDTVYFYENEPHRGIVVGNEPVELLCIIDCPDGIECDPDKP